MVFGLCNVANANWVNRSHVHFEHATEAGQHELGRGNLMPIQSQTHALQQIIMFMSLLSDEERAKFIYSFRVELELHLQDYL